uniref:RRM domain-containing protein n=1 Tax=Parastrongyloides trichosuri TaxID=131310 RepID=A0A0N4ZM71_PARTI
MDTKINIDMSLDDIIAKTGAGKNLRGRGTSRIGKEERKPERVDQKWKHDKFEYINKRRTFPKRHSTGGAVSKFAENRESVPGKMYISNLPKDVQARDLEQLFKGYPYKEISVSYNKFGESLGTATVVTVKRGNVLKLLKDFAGLTIDGNTLEMVDLSSDNSHGNASDKRHSMGGIRREKGSDISKGRQNFPKKNFGTKGVFLNKGKKFDGKKKEKVTVEDLDKDLEEYMKNCIGSKKGDETMEV